jgi:hypothetical protein
MMAGVLQGVPLVTKDADILHRRTPENVARLLGVLREIGAVYRHDPRKIAPGESHLMGSGHQLLTTAFGDLDCLGTIDGEKTYDDMIGSTIRLRLDSGNMITVLELGALIAVKRRAGRPKDLAVIPYLESTLDELRRR